VPLGFCHCVHRCHEYQRHEQGQHKSQYHEDGRHHIHRCQEETTPTTTQHPRFWTRTTVRLRPGACTGRLPPELAPTTDSQPSTLLEEVPSTVTTMFFRTLGPCAICASSNSAVAASSGRILAIQEVAPASSSFDHEQLRQQRTAGGRWLDDWLVQDQAAAP